MVTKGFDFGNVSLVGIVDVDRFLHFPDFRSYEKTYQIITQVSGRAGRRGESGKVIIQTSNPSHLVFQKVLLNDNSFYDNEILERQKYLYPPFARLIKLVIKDPIEETAEVLADKIAVRLKKQLGNLRILGPEPALVSKIKNNFLYIIIVKIEREKINLSKVKSLILEEINLVINSRDFAKSYINIDVDPA